MTYEDYENPTKKGGTGIGNRGGRKLADKPNSIMCCRGQSRIDTAMKSMPRELMIITLLAVVLLDLIL